MRAIVTKYNPKRKISVIKSNAWTLLGLLIFTFAVIAIFIVLLPYALVQAAIWAVRPEHSSTDYPPLRNRF